MVPVESSAVVAIGYDAERRELYVTFTGGETYAYSDVDAEVPDALLRADSIGGYVNREVRDRYDYRRL